MKKEEFLDKLTIELKISKNSEYTLRNYLEANQNLLDFLKKDPDQIIVDDVKKYMAEKLGELSSSTTLLFLSAIRYAFTTIFGKDITTNIKRPSKDQKIPAVLTKKEVDKLIDAISTKKSKLMIHLIYACGFRVSELTNLKIVDLNFEEMIGYVRKAKGKKDRAFNLPKLLLTQIKKQVEKQKELNQEYLFSGPMGKLS